ncbi:hypothetical protein PR001_g24623 [Phytophthora rubi]|uniref:Reverse transcriptase RNase H-like domain-containing protein n=1 Tax=Phytophthora rubi TaxID=129364 RepID=A0A6A3IB00_9STRA|nr:hypothetical protein PR001_g24623 [Phytophthora rubi]
MPATSSTTCYWVQELCDHRNLIHVFAPDEHAQKHVKGKLLRWAMKLMNYNYVKEHIACLQRDWADMISRWAGNHDPVATAIQRVRAETPGAPNQHGESTERANLEVTEPIISTLRPLDDANFVWPTFDAIMTAQSASHPPSGAERTPDGVLRLHGRIWIP